MCLSYYTLNDAMSGFWHVSLDLPSGLLTTFNTPWGMFRCSDNHLVSRYPVMCFRIGWIKTATRGDRHS